MSLNIGNLRLDYPVFLAPMAGVTDFPFRKTLKRISSNLSFSEMIASKELLSKSKKSMYRLGNNDLHGISAVQIAGYDPYIMSEASKLIEQKGASIIDINMGCPAKKVTGHYSGSALMKDLDLAKNIIDSTVKSVNIPVTLKMRLGWDENSRNSPELAKIAEDLGIQLITVHGRTRSQFYKGNADWNFISKIKNKVNIPIIANGDITDLDTAKRAFRLSKADGIMIGRGAIGRPWFLSQLSKYFSYGKNILEPNNSYKYDIVRGHYEEILSYYGKERGVKNARKHLIGYINSCGINKFNKDQVDSLKRVNDSSLVLKLIKQFFI
ncbi:tRNA dihydrouridine synthase DusB [Alphaproteobacteria bacterium]|nr:tRNA dihydrouridine synthase DusB [Alphaproteobacteria bacterium]